MRQCEEERTIRVKTTGPDGRWRHVDRKITVKQVPFPLLTQAPEPKIIKPEFTECRAQDWDAAKEMRYCTVLLEGEAWDTKDGWLSDSSLVWRTDRTDLQSGELGEGRFLSVKLYTFDCWGSRHRLTLTATDSDGNRKTAEHVFHVRFPVDFVC